MKRNRTAHIAVTMKPIGKMPKTFAVRPEKSARLEAYDVSLKEFILDMNDSRRKKERIPYYIS